MLSDQTPLLAQLRSILLRYRFILLALFVAGAGLFLIVASGRTASPEISRNLGVAFLTAGTIGLALEFSTRRQFEELLIQRLSVALEATSLPARLDDIAQLLSLGSELRTLGLLKVHPHRPAQKIARLLEAGDPDTEIRLLGICMMSLTNEPMQAILLSKLQCGCTIKFLTLDSQSEFVKQRAHEETRGLEDIHDDIVASDQLHSNFIRHRVPSSMRQKIQYGYYDSAPGYFIAATNKAMIVGFYLRAARGERFPHLELEVKGGGIYEHFHRHFEQLWEARRERRTGMDVAAPPRPESPHKVAGADD